MNCMIFCAFRGGVLTVSRLTAGIQSCKSKANKLNFIQCSLFAGATYVKPQRFGPYRIMQVSSTIKERFRGTLDGWA